MALLRDKSLNFTFTVSQLSEPGDASLSRLPEWECIASRANQSLLTCYESLRDGNLTAAVLLELRSSCSLIGDIGWL